MNNEFEKYKIDKSIIETLSLLKYTTPTKIQELVVPAMLEGREVVRQQHLQYHYVIKLFGRKIHPKH